MSAVAICIQNLVAAREDLLRIQEGFQDQADAVGVEIDEIDAALLALDPNRIARGPSLVKGELHSRPSEAQQEVLTRLYLDTDPIKIETVTFNPEPQQVEIVAGCGSSCHPAPDDAPPIAAAIEPCPYCGKTDFKNGLARAGHMGRCSLNPSPIVNKRNGPHKKTRRWEDAARHYADAVELGLPVTKYVSDKMGIVETTAHNYIQRARTEGLIKMNAPRNPPNRPESKPKEGPFGPDGKLLLPTIFVLRCEDCWDFTTRNVSLMGAHAYNEHEGREIYATERIAKLKDES